MGRWITYLNGLPTSRASQTSPSRSTPTCFSFFLLGLTSVLPRNRNCLSLLQLLILHLPRHHLLLLPLLLPLLLLRLLLLRLPHHCLFSFQCRSTCRSLACTLSGQSLCPSLSFVPMHL